MSRDSILNVTEIYITLHFYHNNYAQKKVQMLATFLKNKNIVYLIIEYFIFVKSQHDINSSDLDRTDVPKYQIYCQHRQYCVFSWLLYALRLRYRFHVLEA